jgi:hypothetical protein
MNVLELPNTLGCPKCACMMAMCPGNVTFTLGVANTKGRLP